VLIVLILKVVKVLCFDALLEVLILKEIVEKGVCKFEGRKVKRLWERIGGHTACRWDEKSAQGYETKRFESDCVMQRVFDEARKRVNREACRQEWGLGVTRHITIP
jgi:predicted HicB family RNase H-like nuclease